MLQQMANNRSRNVVSWQPHGKAFRVHYPEVFASEIMPRYFKQTKYKSFQRQLHMYGFHRTKKGIDKGAYYHDLFVQNNKSMCLRMVREKSWKGTAGKKNHDQHKTEAPDHPQYYNYDETNRDHMTTTMAEPVLSMGDFSWVTAKNNTCSVGGAGGSLDLPGYGRSKGSVSTGNVASVFVKEHIEDGDEVFFEGKRFHFVPLV